LSSNLFRSSPSVKDNTMRSALPNELSVPNTNS